MDLNIKRVITLSKLKSLGLLTEKLESKVLNGNYKSINSIYNTLIKGKTIKHKILLKNALSLKSFRQENFFCSKHKTTHYLGSKVYNKCFGDSIVKGSLSDKIFVVKFTLNNILLKSYRNNRNNKEFQGLIDYLIGLCELDILTEINKDLRLWIIKSYKTVNTKYFNKAKMLLSKKINVNIVLIKEIFGIVKLIRHYNDLSVKDSINYLSYNGKPTNVILGYNKPNNLVDRVYNKKNIDFEGYIMDLSDYLFDLINTNDQTKEIMQDLNFSNLKFNNDVLYTQIETMINQYKETLYNMQYGIKYSDKTDSKDQYFMGALPFSDSGKFENKLDDFENLEYYIIHCFNKDYIEILNHINKSKNFNLIMSGNNNKGYKVIHKKKRMHKYVVYNVNDNLTFDKSFDLKGFCNKVYQKCVNDLNERSKYPDYSNVMNRIDFSFNYDNSNRKKVIYNQYIQNMHCKHYFSKPAIFFPLRKKRKNTLYSNQGILQNKPSTIKIDIDDFGKHTIRKLKHNNLGNLRRDHTKRSQLSQGLVQMIDRFDNNVKMGKPLIKNPKLLNIYNAITINLKPFVFNNLYLNDVDLETMVKELLHDYKDFFITHFGAYQYYRLNTVKIQWNNKGRYSYRLLGRYYGFTNLIKLQNTLRLLPKWVIKCTIWHELLHIQYSKHNKEFKNLDKQYKYFDKCNVWESFITARIRKLGIKTILNKLNENKSNNYLMYFSYNLNKTLQYTRKTKESGLFKLIFKDIMNNSNIRDSLITYYNDSMYKFQTKIDLRTKNIRKLTTKKDKLNKEYNELPNKRVKTAKTMKKYINTIDDQITLHNTKIKPLLLKRSLIGRYLSNIFLLNKVLKPSDYIKDFLITDISKYYHKNLIRFVNTQRSTIEIINYGLNNLFYPKYIELALNLQDTKIISNGSDSFENIDYIDGFDKLLDYFDNTKTLQTTVKVCKLKLSLDKFLRINLNLAKWLYNPLEYTQLIENYISITENYRTSEISILNT